MKIAQSLPEWVETWLSLPFYGDKCRKHANKYNTVYCGTCNQEPVCVICWEYSSDQHDADHHQILHVRKASGRAAIEITKIRKFLNISEIQIYSINDKAIVFLNPHKQGASDAHLKPNCHTCRRTLIKEEAKFGYKFCSIACKILRKEVGDVEIEKKSDDEEKIERATIKLTIKRNMMMIKRKMMMISDQYWPGSLRKRSRKGIPRRAPLK